MESAPFEDGNDFIPLGADSDDEDQGQDRNAHSKGKEREREGERARTRDASSPRPPSASPPPLPRRDSRDRYAGENGQGREWDRNKRKYDMIFDPSDGYQNKKQRTDAKSRLAPWVDQVNWDGCKSAAQMLHREVEGFVNWISPTPQEDEIRGLVVAIISHAVTTSFPDASVYPFGSFATKLYLPLGDIDLVICSQSMAYANTHNVLTALASTIKRSGITTKVTIIAKAKVPIVKFVTNHEYGRFNVDLSINQQNGIVAGGIINGFLREFGSSNKSSGCLALRALVLLTKLFLSQRGMNEVYTGGLGSYAIVCLAISFLQMHPKIRHGQIDADANLGVLVVEFFELYGRSFNYEEVGISLRDGGSYFGKRQRGWGWNEQWGGAKRGGLLSIEDPGDPSNDISSGSYNFQNVRRNLGGAYEILTAAIYMRAGILGARRSGQAVSLRDHDEPGDMSILSTNTERRQTLNNRALVKDVYRLQTLHRLLGVAPRIPPTVSVNGQGANGHANGVNGHANGVNGQDAKPKSKNSSRARTPTGPRSSNGAKAGAHASVEDAWAEAEMVISSDDEADRRLRQEQEEEEGRYAAIGAPPKKRRRTGRYGNGEDGAHGVTFTADSDESEEEEEMRSKSKPKGKGRRKERLAGVLGPGKGTEVGGSLQIKGMGSRSSSTSSLDPAEKRDYWLSKGVWPGGDDHSES
ncbi:hypothetical protein C8F04DRAFT_1265053 [Mycena alexandri]|uniref:polynucleotide adenylyltransferase n=1 Tax=Mycena alexandri TaxID=1745969 RepID=A0AAD6SKT6_9AGAR|nr:hypothetical protein C8F04DRAFT_1265053 [Mycena alexandri]